MSRGQVQPAGPSLGPPGDDTGCPILHVDMDAFYASVEIRRRPELRGLPVIVGGSGSSGVVTSASYEARRFGVHSAMPMLRARRLCPQGVVVPPDFASYQQASAGVMAVFRSITPLVEPISLDEAFLDVSGALRRLGPPRQIAELIRARVEDEQQITCSVGVAPSKFVAKLASAHCKPNGVLVVPRDGVVSFLHPLPVGALWGVGAVTEQVICCSSSTLALISSAICRGGPSRRSAPETSRNASSREIGSTSGVTDLNTAITPAEACW